MLFPDTDILSNNTLLDKSNSVSNVLLMFILVIPSRYSIPFKDLTVLSISLLIDLGLHLFQASNSQPTISLLSP